MANGWQKLASKCEISDATANQISAEWYQTNASQLAKDYTQLATQYLGLAQLYDKEANALKYVQNESDVSLFILGLFPLLKLSN